MVLVEEGGVNPRGRRMPAYYLANLGRKLQVNQTNLDQGLHMNSPPHTNSLMRLDDGTIVREGGKV